MKTGLTKKLVCTTLLAGLAAPVAFAPAASAQAAEGPFFRNRHTAVTDRSQPEYDPLAIRAGAFNINSSLGVGVMYNDNVYGDDNNEVEDTIFTVNPQANASSNWSRHSLNAGFSINHREFNEQSDETMTEGSAYVGGRLDVTRELQFGGNLSGGRFSEQRYQPSVPEAAAEPTRFDQINVNGNVTWTRDRFRLFGDIAQSDVDFDDVDRVPPVPPNPAIPPTIDQDFRDMVDTSYTLRGYYGRSDPQSRP
jgi:hypothetical protein